MLSTLGPDARETVVDVHTSLGSQLEDTGLVDHAREHFSLARELGGGTDITFKVREGSESVATKMTEAKQGKGEGLWRIYYPIIKEVGEGVLYVFTAAL